MENFVLSEDFGIEAWHFPKPDLRLGFGDGRLIAPGEVLSVMPPVKVGSQGLHGSISILDAVINGNSSIICRTLHFGAVSCKRSLVASSHRKVLWMANARKVIRRFTKDCVLGQINISYYPKVIRKYLESDDEDLREEAIAANRSSIIIKATLEDPLWSCYEVCHELDEQAFEGNKRYHNSTLFMENLSAELERRIMALAPT